jgi:DNA-binding NtrC family response regulator
LNPQAQELESRLNELELKVPGVLNVYDLFARLEGRFELINIGDRISLSDSLEVRIRKSFHKISYEREGFIPALDFVVKQDGKAKARCVYLSDTEYRPELHEQYAEEAEVLGTIDLLICNVKTLNVAQYAEDHSLNGFTQKHLGWNGLIQLTKDLRAKDLLSPTSLVVLRAWGIETVARLDPTDRVPVATPENLQIYEEEFLRRTEQQGIVPGRTWIRIERGRRPEVDHRIVPYRSDHHQFGSLFYCSQVMRDLILEAKAVTDSPETTVLILGETGTGKDELADAIHHAARRQSNRNGRLMHVNAQLVSGDMFKSELFGHARGAFTGADRDHVGKLEEARNGTVVIDEIGDLPEADQVKLFSVLDQSRVFQRVGENYDRELNAQVIMTTDQSTDVIREQLRHRAGRILKIPALRERKEDIPAILDGWRQHERGISMPAFDDDLIELLQRYDWPGNVRQLKNAVQQIAQRGDSSYEAVRAICDATHNLASAPRELQILPTEDAWDEVDRSLLNEMPTTAPVSSRHLQERLSLSKGTINQRLRRLIAQNQVAKVGGGKNTKYKRLRSEGSEAEAR